MRVAAKTGIGSLGSQPAFLSLSGTPCKHLTPDRKRRGPGVDRDSRGNGTAGLFPCGLGASEKQFHSSAPTLCSE